MNNWILLGFFLVMGLPVVAKAQAAQDQRVQASTPPNGQQGGQPSVPPSVLPRVSPSIAIEQQVGSAEQPEKTPHSAMTATMLTAKLRERLSPLIQAALEKHCGEDCPSFKIDAQYKKSIVRDVLEDLGFSHSESAELPPSPELQSITLSVLVQDRVTPASREALKQILTHLVNNETPVPTQVQLKPLNALSPTLEKKAEPKAEPTSPPESDHRMEIFQMLVWPLSLLFLALMGMVGLVLFLKNRRDLIRDRLLGQNKLEKPESRFSGLKEASGTSVSPEVLEAMKLLEGRQEDFHWLMEDLVLRGDVKSLSQVVSLFEPQTLSTQLKFSNQALKVLSSLSSASQKSSVNGKESLAWLKENIDRVHWKRLEEQYFPLSKLTRLSDHQRVQVFMNLSSAHEKAALLASIPEEKWPLLLSQISSEERLELGLSLSRYRVLGMEDRVKLEFKLSSQMNEKLNEILINSLSSLEGVDEVMEKFTLYLTETEAQGLWKELSKNQLCSGQSKKPPIFSIDSLVQSLDVASATEIFTSLEVESLAALIFQLSAEGKQKVLLSLPKGLRERLSTFTQTPTEVQLMKARAKMIDTHRRFTSALHPGG